MFVAFLFKKGRVFSGDENIVIRSITTVVSVDVYHAHCPNIIRDRITVNSRYQPSHETGQCMIITD